MAYDATKIIKQVAVGGVNYDVEALWFGGKSYDEIVAMISQARMHTKVDSANTGKTAPATTASANTVGWIYLVALGTEESGTYTEFITVEGGTESAPTYTWEKIGTTSTDLSEYAKKGSYTSGSPSSNVTSSAGAQTASGSATISYKKSDAATGAAGGVTISGSNFGFSGTKATITSTGSYKPAGSVSYSGSTAATKKGVKVSTTACGATEKGTVTISGGTASGTVAAVTGITGFSGGSLGGTTSFNTDAIKNVKLSSATVTSTGAVQYLEDVTHTAASLGGEKTFVTSITGFSGGSLNPATTVTVVTGVTGASASGTTTVITGYPKFSGGSATGTFNTDAIKSIGGTRNYGFSASTSNVMSAPTVSNGVLSWTVSNADTRDAHTGTAAATASVDWTAADLGTPSTVSVVTGVTGGTASGTTSVVPSYTLTAASLGTQNKGTVTISGGSISKTTKYLTGSGDAASKGTVTLTAASLGTLSTATVVTGVTAASLGGTTTFVTSALKAASLAEDDAATPAFAFNTDGIKAITGLSFAGTTASISVSSEYTPAGSITGSQTVGNHTHSIGLTDTSVTGTASVAVSNHTHDLSNHTHSTTI